MARDAREASSNLIRKIKQRVAVGQIFRNTDLEAIGRLAVNEMIADTEDGRSPITGNAYAPYKKPKRYPGKRKPHRPVNLRLTGQFLRSLRFDVRRGAGTVGVVVFLAGALAKAKERGHRYGANRQPKRPLIPMGKQQLRRGIRDKIRALITERIRAYRRG